MTVEERIEYVNKVEDVKNLYQEIDKISYEMMRLLTNIRLCREKTIEDEFLSAIVDDYIDLAKRELGRNNSILAKRCKKLLELKDVVTQIPRYLRYGAALQFIFEDCEELNESTISENVLNYKKALNQHNLPKNEKYRFDKMVYESQQLAINRNKFLLEFAKKDPEYNKILSEIQLIDFVDENEKVFSTTIVDVSPKAEEPIEKKYEDKPEEKPEENKKHKWDFFKRGK